MPKAQYAQKFRESWIHDPVLSEWITKVESTVGVVAKCKWCSCTLANKYSDLKAHGTTKKHLSKKKILLGATQPKLNFAKMSTSEDARMAECRIALFIASHTAISTVDHLTPLCKTTFQGTESASYLNMHRTKCSAIIKNILAPYFENQLHADIGDRGFSILIDESTDISVLKYLGCSIIYFSEKQKKIVSTFLALAELENVNAEGIFNCLLQVMQKHKLKLNKLQGIGTDNASVMTGINNGVFAKLKQHNPNLILIRCICHSIQLAASAATKELPRNLEFLIRETYDWFARSASRQLAYKTLFKTINDGQDPNKITQACATRWLSIESSVTKIYEQWLELKTHFQITSQNDERCYTAQLLYQMFNDDFNYAYLSFLKPILKDLNRVNKNFESNSADPTKLLDDLISLLKSLVAKVTTPNSTFKLFVDNIENYVDGNAYLGYLFENEIKKMKERGFQDERNLRERCLRFLVTLIKELINRVPENVEVLKQISIFSVNNVLKQNKPDIVPILKFFKISDGDIASIEIQWQNINLMKWNNVTDTGRFWSEVLQYKDSNDTVIFEELANVAVNILSLPHSNADVERLFSQMNIIKNKTRNRMQLTMLSAILGVRAGLKLNNKCCFNYAIPIDILNKIKTLETYKNNEDDEELFDVLI